MYRSLKIREDEYQEQERKYQMGLRGRFWWWHNENGEI